MRMEMLSDQEEKVVDALRLVAKSQEQIQRQAAQMDLRKELEDIYHLLINAQSWETEELLGELIRRIHNLLY